MKKLTELGTQLKEAREAKGYSLEDVQALTKIQKRYLQGIEEGNYAMMPGSFYVRAFIKQYAEAVDLNPEELFEAHAADIPSNFEEQFPSHVTRKKTKSGTGLSKFSDFMPTVLVVVFVLGFLFLAWSLAQGWFSENNDANEPGVEVRSDPVGLDQSEGVDVDSEDESDSGSEDALTIENVGVEGDTTTYEILNADSIEVSITSDDTWAGLYDPTTDELLDDKNVTGGNTETFDTSGQERFKIRIGSTVETVVKINGEDVEFGSSLNTQNMVFEVK